MKVLLALCACVAGLLAAPVAASACASLAGVASFRGHARLSYMGTASGEDPGSGGTESIGLDRTAEVDVALIGKESGHGLIAFVGKASGGSVTVHDTFANTGTKASGEETAGGPSVPSIASLSASTLTCKYTLQVSFGVKGSYSGDPLVQPDATVTGVAYSDPHNIPGDLILAGAPVPPAYYSCPSGSGGAFGMGPSCYAFGGDWTGEYAMLASCHATSGNCPSTENPIGTAQFSWLLKPTLKRHKKKR